MVAFTGASAGALRARLSPPLQTGPALRQQLGLPTVEQAGISYISVSERDWLDTTGKWAFVITMMMATIAQMEVDQLSARTRAGLDRAKRQGKQLGRPRRFVDLDTAVMLRGRGHSLAEIGRRLKVSSRTLKRRLAVESHLRNLP